MRIGIDGFNLALPNGTGVATYGLTLARTLAAAGEAIEGVYGIDAGRDPALREILFFEQLGKVPPAPTIEQRRRAARARNRVAINPVLRLRAAEVPLTARVDKAPLADRLPPLDRLVTSSRLFDYAHRHFHYYGRFVPLRMDDPPPIMHWTYPVPVELVGARNVYTVHDLVPLKLPYTTLEGKRTYRRLIARCIAGAAQICTVSEASRADLVAEFGADPARITNTYQASPLPAGWIDDAGADAEIVRGVFGLEPQRYFLFFGAIEPKKNLGRMIEAFLSTRSALPLVLAGGRSWQSEGELILLPTGEEAETARGRAIADRIVRLDHLPRALLLRLIRGARAVLFPSLYEGFGLPILEAMQLGTPVLTSPIGAMAEVAGDAALYADPYDPQALAEALRALEADDDLCARLAQAGLRQAGRFTERIYLERLRALYRAAAADGR